MEHQVERLVAGAKLCLHALLDFFEQFGTQLYVAGLVDTVHVAESHGGHVATVLTESERLDGGDGVFDGGVQVFVDVVTHAVFLATNDADFNFENRVYRACLCQHHLGDLEVLFQRHCRAVPHV